MTENNSRHLLDRLAEIEDPRNADACLRVCKDFGTIVTHFIKTSL